MSLKTTMRAAAVGAGLSAALLGGSVAASAQTATPTASDLAMSCQQITDGVTAQNAIIKEQGDTIATLSSQQPDPGAADPRILTRKAQIKSDHAKDRATALVAAGRQKKCFQ